MGLFGIYGFHPEERNSQKLRRRERKVIRHFTAIAEILVLDVNANRKAKISYRNFYGRLALGLDGPG